jgi:anion-transporting  ArsA/GET3 family ATPase
MGEKNKDQIIHWISGKGGVGKSTVAAALAISLARSGFRTLLVELGEKGFYRLVFNVEVAHEPREIQPRLSIARWDGEECLKEYLLYLLKLERIVDLFFENRVMKSLVQAAPGLKELALAGKITSGIRGVGPTLPFDRIVVDGYSTGHFRTLVESPHAMAQAIPVGPMGEQSRSIDAVLRSAHNCYYHVVVAPEELPVVEGLELAKFIQDKFGLEPEMILNRWLAPPVTLEEMRNLPESEFLSYLRFLLERQNSLENQVLQQTKKTKRVPYSWEFTARERLERLAPLWEKEWKSAT